MEVSKKYDIWIGEKDMDEDRKIELVKNGKKYENTEKYEEAIESHDKAIEIDPYYKEAYNSRGLVYDDIEEYSKWKIEKAN